MSNVGQKEYAIPNRIVQILGYRYLGDWQGRANNKNIEIDMVLSNWLEMMLKLTYE